MKSLIQLLMTLSLLTSECISAGTDRAGELRFNAHVPERCGIEVIDQAGEVSFGQQYTGRAIQLRAENNIEEGQIRLKLNYADFGELSSRIPPSRIRFKVDVPQSYEGDVDYWRDGVVLDKQQLAQDDMIYIQARIDLDESQIPAGELVMRLEWSTECVR
ncbi:hypothetical protein [Vibrio methylphosphonaticus]|uniref:hypothetical protein n=1 Tax=Vibrio methylphosphonaticus TaxID=2946866 RepID=UPI00202A56FD|nr:hypothetical protein [Vibrio methylphosphonaticus]MCL9776767.1 hypothetical protein [Vibrio methylphosphonaticus]